MPSQEIFDQDHLLTYHQVQELDHRALMSYTREFSRARELIEVRRKILSGKRTQRLNRACILDFRQTRMKSA